MRRETIDTLVAGGFKRESFYCPSFFDHDSDVMWNGGATYRVMGYAFYLKNSARVLSYYQQSRMTVPSEVPRLPAMKSPPLYRPPITESVLVADAILSEGENMVTRSANKWNNIQGSWGVYRAPHLDGAVAAGGNLLYLDGHVSWQQLSKMYVRSTGSPAFWW